MEIYTIGFTQTTAERFFTRLAGSRICVAGIETMRYRHVRPVTGPGNPLTRMLLRENGGPFGAGALVDIGSVKACPIAPETEDHRFDSTGAKRLGDVGEEPYLERWVICRSRPVRRLWPVRR